MSLPQHFVDLADFRLEEAGFSTKSLADFDLPAVSYADNDDHDRVAYQVYGKLDAPNVIIESSPFFTSVINDHFALRLHAQQTVLGHEYAVIGIDSYDPTVNFTKRERHTMTHGSFAPLSQREFAVLNHSGIENDQKLLSYGYSLGADVAVQLAHDTEFDSNRGLYLVEGLGAIEMARTRRRGAVLVTVAMAKSGGDLAKNIVDSKMPALDEAWGITDRTNAEQSVKDQSDGSIKDYLKSGRLNNLAIVRGFGTNKSAKQLASIIESTFTPVLLGRQKRSTVFSSRVFDKLGQLTNNDQLALLEEDNDHSSDDNLRLSAARILYFASLTEA